MLDDGRPLAESNAILRYLSPGTTYLPNEDFDRAKVLQWMFFEQYSHDPNIAVVRYWVSIAADSPRESVIEARRKAGYEALDAMERELATREFLVAHRYTIADIALYAYTHIAGEGGFDLSGYPAIRRWLDRVSSTRPPADCIAGQAAAGIPDCGLAARAVSWAIHSPAVRPRPVRRRASSAGRRSGGGTA